MKKTEICTQCSEEYVPRRCGVQKFCSNSCRSRHWLLKQNRIKVPTIADKQKNQLPDVKSETKKEVMSFAGFGNAAAGVVAVEVVKGIFTPEHNKPATKKDIEELKLMINGGRYFPVNNVPIDGLGRSPYFDFKTGNVVYL
jgi:hypothetical protein